MSLDEWGGVVITVTTMLAKWARMLTVAWQHSCIVAAPGCASFESTDVIIPM